MADIYQGKHFGAITGLAVAGFGIGGAFSPWLGGKIYDDTGTYIPAFYIVIGAILLAIICSWIAAPREIRLVPGKVPSARRR
jgi:nitrate/nitrite transporter NarK